MNYQESIIEHYQIFWGKTVNIYLWDKGPTEKMSSNFRVLEFEPQEGRNYWTYATCCMSGLNDAKPIELHLFSLKRDDSIIELLTSVSYYYKHTAKVDLWHSINFGRPWQNHSICDHGIISLPYVDGPELENLNLNDKVIKFYWIIPITKSEVEFKKKNGVEALENRFEEVGLDYINPDRKSII